YPQRARRVGDPAATLEAEEKTALFNGRALHASLPLRRGDRIDQQHGHGHRPDAAGHRRDVGRLLAHALEVDVADELAVGQAVDADIDDHGAGLHHLRQDQIGHAGGDDQHVGEQRELREVTGRGVTDAYGRVALHQHQRHRLADDVAGADHDDVLPLDRNAFVLEQLHHAIGRAGREHGVADDEAADIIEVEAIDILLR